MDVDPAPVTFSYTNEEPCKSEVPRWISINFTMPIADTAIYGLHLVRKKVVFRDNVALSIFRGLKLSTSLSLDCLQAVVVNLGITLKGPSP